MVRPIQTGVTMERPVLESLLAGDDEAPMKALATLRSGPTYWVGDGERPSSVHPNDPQD